MPNENKPDDPTKNPEHLYNTPAGHKRDEENRRRTDKFQELAEAQSEETGGIPSDAMKPEREILDKFNPYTFDLDVSHKQKGRVYRWILANTTVIATYQQMGFNAVQGKDPECEEYRGQHRAAGTSLRGVGDVLLYWCREDQFAKIQAHYEAKLQAMNGVEEEWEMEANFGPTSPTRGFGPLAHGKRNDPLLQRTVLRGTRGQVENLMNALKSGRPVGGIKPGDDVRG